MLISTEIRNLSHCYAFPKGDILSWTQSRYTSNKAAIESAHDLSFLCDEDKKLIISTQPQTFSSALDTCRILGGVLMVPQSLEDNNAILNLFKIHEKSCLLQQSCTRNQTANNMKCHSDEPVAWIGLKQKGDKWWTFRLRWFDWQVVSAEVWFQYGFYNRWLFISLCAHME